MIKNNYLAWRCRITDRNITTSKGKLMIPCLCCGKLFEYDSRKGGRKFCDDNCRMNYYGIKLPNNDTVKKVCRYCGKTFECSSSTPTKVFCSRDCAGAFYKEKRKTEPKKDIRKEIRICPYCGKEFTWMSNKASQKYCSNECMSKANKERIMAYKWKEERKCAYCGNTFEWHSDKSGQKYCSLECRKAATKMLIRDYQRRKYNEKNDEALRNEVYLKVLNIISKMDQSKGASFGGRAIDYRVVGDISEKTREYVLQRDSHECQVCKRKDSLQLHHLIKRKNGGNHDPENLITLCASCHRHIETGNLDHAVRKCFKNTKKFYNEENTKSVDIDSLKFRLNVLFNKLKESPAGEDTEIMVYLDEAIDLIDMD